jgi:outer membrane protein OmpA-like peptidoglycan-associated protein
MTTRPTTATATAALRLPTLRDACLSAAFAALLFGAADAFAQNVLLYKRGEVPDPDAIARILGNRPATHGPRIDGMAPGARTDHGADVAGDADDDAPVRTRGIRLLPADAPETARAPAERIAVRPVLTDAAIAARPAPRERAAATSFALQVQFPFNSAELQPEMLPQLDAVAEGIRRADPNTRVVLEGHTDAAGTNEYNQFLSRRRAEAVRQYLVGRHGIPAQLFVVVGRGKFAPLLPDNPFAAENRRVEFRLADS